MDDSKAQPLCINVGSGPIAVQGWINTDRSPGIFLDRLRPLKKALGALGLLSDAHMVHWSRDVIYNNVLKGLPFEARSVDAIYSSHTLEHLYLADVRQTLTEFLRVLAPNGILRLALPNGLKWAEDLVRGERNGDNLAGLEFNRRLLMQPESRPRGKGFLLMMVGGHTHRWQPTPLLVETLLTDAGFSGIEHLGFREGSLPRLDTVEHRPESFFIEARPM